MVGGNQGRRVKYCSSLYNCSRRDAQQIEDAVGRLKKSQNYRLKFNISLRTVRSCIHRVQLMIR
jgi:hypothetical protein